MAPTDIVDCSSWFFCSAGIRRRWHSHEKRIPRKGEHTMRRLIFVALLTTAPLLALDAKPASACGWGGYGYGYGAYRYSSYRPAYAYASFYRPRVWGWRAWGWRRGWRRW